MAFTLAVSVLVGTRGKTVAATLLAVVGSIGILNLLSIWLPWLDPGVWAVGALGSDGHALVAGNPVLLLLVAGVWCGLTVIAAWLAAAAFARWPYLSPGWLLVGVVSVGFAMLLPNALQGVKPAVSAIQPVGVSQTNMAGDHLAADGKRVCVAGGTRFVAVDFSDPASPRRLAEAVLPEWTFSSVRLRGTRVILGGRREAAPEDRAGVLVLDMTSRETQIVADLGAAGGRDWIGGMELVGGYLYAGAGSRWGAALRVFDLTGGTTARETAVIDVEKPLDPSVRFVSPLQFGMCVRGTYAYLASTGTLMTLDVSDPAHPKVVGRTEFVPANLIAVGMPQQVAVAGGRLYVEGVSPRRLLAFDLTDPARPSPAERYDWQLQYTSVLGASGERLYICRPPLVLTPRPGLWPGRIRQITESATGRPAPVAFGDYLLVLADGRISAYDLAGGD